MRQESRDAPWSIRLTASALRTATHWCGPTLVIVPWQPIWQKPCIPILQSSHAPPFRLDPNILDTRYIIKRPWFTARCDKVQLPNGKINSEYYILEYPTWVNVIAITEDGQFLMVEQYRHGLRDVFMELVAGVVETGEEPLAAAKRELLEETGYGEWTLNTVISQAEGRGFEPRLPLKV